MLHQNNHCLSNLVVFSTESISQLSASSFNALLALVAHRTSCYSLSKLQSETCEAPINCTIDVHVNSAKNALSVELVANVVVSLSSVFYFLSIASRFPSILTWTWNKGSNFLWSDCRVCVSVDRFALPDGQMVRWSGIDTETGGPKSEPCY